MNFQHSLFVQYKMLPFGPYPITIGHLVAEIWSILWLFKQYGKYKNFTILAYNSKSILATSNSSPLILSQIFFLFVLWKQSQQQYRNKPNNLKMAQCENFFAWKCPLLHRYTVGMVQMHFCGKMVHLTCQKF